METSRTRRNHTTHSLHDESVLHADPANSIPKNLQINKKASVSSLKSGNNFKEHIRAHPSMKATELHLEPIEEHRNKVDLEIKTSRTTRMPPRSLPLLFVPPKLLQSNLETQTNFYSFGKLMKTHHGQVKNFQPELTEPTTDRSHLRKQLDFNKNQQDSLDHALKNMQELKIKNLINKKKEQTLKEKMMPKVRVYPSRSVPPHMMDPNPIKEDNPLSDGDEDKSKRLGSRFIKNVDNITSTLR